MGDQQFLVKVLSNFCKFQSLAVSFLRRGIVTVISIENHNTLKLNMAIKITVTGETITQY